MNQTVPDRVSSGVAGIDAILHGGFQAGRIYLVHGNAGTGKTTLGLQFLMAGAASAKHAMCITLLQTRSEIEQVVASHGWDFSGVEIVELPTDVRDTATQSQTVFTPGDVELTEVTEEITRAVERHRPDCLFIDSLSELGVIVDTRYQLQRQILRMKQALDRIGCTTLLSAGPPGDLDTATLETLVHGVIGLDMLAPEFGRPRRRVLVSKMRGMDFQAGYHDAIIRTGGLTVFPRVEAVGVPVSAGGDRVVSGNDGLDALLGGGLETGSTCVITGTAGAGKSTLATLYGRTAARSGIRSAVFCFDERIETVLERSASLGMPVADFVDQGLIALTPIRVGEVSPGHFSALVRSAVDEDGARIVVIDSLSGYLQSMPGARALITQMHELLAYLSARGVLTLMVVATHGLFGETESPVDVSYLADAVVMLRHFEAEGEMRRCIAVLKKRYGDHERTIREVLLGSDGIRVGEPLTRFEGILTGQPRYRGATSNLMASEDTERAPS